MKHIIAGIILLASTLSAEGIHWEKDLIAAVAKAKQEHKPIFFVLSSHYCKWCYRLEQDTFQDKRVIDALNRTHVNAIAFYDERDYVPSSLRVSGTPAMWFLNSDGTPLFQPIRGYAKPDLLIMATKEVVKEYAKINAPAVTSKEHNDSL